MGGNEGYDYRICEQKEKACMAKMIASEKANADKILAMEKRLILRLESVEKINDVNQKGLHDTITRALDTCNDVLKLHDRALAEVRKDLSKKCVAMDEKVAYNLKDSKVYTDDEIKKIKTCTTNELKELDKDVRDLKLEVPTNLREAKEYTDTELTEPKKHIRSLLNWRTYLLGAVGFITFLAYIFKAQIIAHFVN